MRNAQSFGSFISLLLLLFSTTNASHFRGGTLSWRAMKSSEGQNSTHKFVLTFRVSWRRTHGSNARDCNADAIAKREYVRSTNKLTCTGCKKLKDTNSNFICTDYSVLLNMVTGERTVVVESGGTNILKARFTACCWLRLKNGGGAWNIWSNLRTKVTREKIGRINSSPYSGSSLLQVLQEKCTQTIDLRVTDPDNDYVKCRWAVGTECGKVCKRLPGSVLDKATCKLYFNGTAKPGSYGLDIIMEDFLSPNHKIPLSQASINFVISVQSSKVSCKERPYYLPSTVADSSCLGIQINSTFQELIHVQSQKKNDKILEFITKSPPGLRKSKVMLLDKDRAVYGMKVTWIPTEKDVGPNTFCFIAISRERATTEQRCITLLVGDSTFRSNTSCDKRNPDTPSTPSSSITTPAFSSTSLPTIATSASTPTPAATVFCVQDITGASSSRGQLSWPRTAAGITATLTCPHGPEGIRATRKCKTNLLKNVGTWGPVHNSECAFGNKVTKTLQTLTKQNVTTSNVANITTEVKEVSKDKRRITSEDTTFISEIVEKVVASNLVEGKVANLLLDSTSNLMKSNTSSLLDAQVEGGSLSRLVKNMAVLANVLPLPNVSGVPETKISEDIAVQAVQFSGENFKGVDFTVKSDDGQFKEDDISLNKNKTKEEPFVISVKLPPSLLDDAGKDSGRLGFVVYRDDSLFKSIQQTDKGIYKEVKDVKVGGMIVSIEVAGKKTLSLSKPIKLSFKVTKTNSENRPRCAFWNFTINGGLGGWASEGCRLTDFTDGIAGCECDHLTNFAVLLDPLSGKTTKPISEEHKIALGFITYVGVGISLAALFITILTLFLFKQLRKGSQPQLTLQLSIALFITLAVFIISMFLKEHEIPCKISAVALHYFLLVTFFWMFVHGFNLYLKFVKVLGAYIKSMMVKMVIFAWGVPAVMVTISASVRWQEYGYNNVCTVTKYAAYGFLFGPICFIIVVNFVVFVLVLKSLSARERLPRDKKQEGWIELTFAAMSCSLLGLTWAFGALAIGDVRLTFQYLFCIFNSLQGLFIFYFQVGRKKNAYIFWVGFLQGKGRTRHPSSVMSSSSRKFTFRTKSRKSSSPTTGDNSCPSTPKEENNLVSSSPQFPLSVSTNTTPDVSFGHSITSNATMATNSI